MIINAKSSRVCFSLIVIIVLEQNVFVFLKYFYLKWFTTIYNYFKNADNNFSSFQRISKLLKNFFPWINLFFFIEFNLFLLLICIFAY